MNTIDAVDEFSDTLFKFTMEHEERMEGGKKQEDTT